MENKVVIEFCTQCRWLMRASWMSQELLTTFSDEITELSLKPGKGGVFKVYANNELVWCRKTEGRFGKI